MRPLRPALGLCWLVCAALGCDETHLAPKTAVEPGVSVATPVVRDVIDYEYATGRTDAEKTVEIRARVSGYLTKVLFQPGVEVNEGDSLFEIDPRPYQAALDRANGELARSEALVQRLVKDQERAQKLPAGTITPQELDKISSDLAEAEADVQVSRAQVESATLDLEFTNIKAPFGGRIGRNLLSEGNLVSASSPIAEPLTTIVTVDPMFAYFDTDELKMLNIQKRIREGKMKSAREAPHTVPVEMGLANEDGYPHQGTIDFVNNRVDPDTGTLQIRGIFSNELVSGKNRILSPGLFVRVRMPLSAPHPAVLVNERAIGIDQGERFVYVVNDKDEVESRQVTMGPLHDGLREITNGVRPEDRVMVSGLQRVRPGMKVKPKTVEMPAPSERATPAPAAEPDAAAPTEGGKA
jgi:multidrug efflux system membrane fusion protein